MSLCNPGNPTGTVFPDEDILALCRMAVSHDFVIITDEAYDYMVYEGSMPVSPLSIEEFRNNVISICSPTPSQFAALAALNGDQNCLIAMREKLVERRELCCTRLNKLKEFFSYVPPKGAFYVMARYLFSEDSSQEIATRLLQEARVITIPGASFGKGGEGHLRISFGGELPEIDEAFDRITQWLIKQK